MIPEQFSCSGIFYCRGHSLLLWLFAITIIFRKKVLSDNSVLRLFFYQYPVIKEPSNVDGVVHELSLYHIWRGGVYTLSSFIIYVDHHINTFEYIPHCPCLSYTTSTTSSVVYIGSSVMECWY